MSMRKSAACARALAAVLGILIARGGSAAHAQLAPPRFLKASVTAPRAVTPSASFTLVVNLTIDKPYHIQANNTKPPYIPTAVKVGPVKGLTVRSVVYPASIRARIGGETLPVYEGHAAVKVIGQLSPSVHGGMLRVPIVVNYQGCNDTSCFPPSSISLYARVSVKARAGSRASARRTAAAAGAPTLAQGTSGVANPPGAPGGSLDIPGFRATKITQFMPPKPFVGWLKQGGSQAGLADTVRLWLGRGGFLHLLGALALIYLLGLALNLTPCCYPVIPITIGYFGRQAASGASTAGLAVSYALGIALMYSALGLLAALLGNVFGAQLSNPYVLVGFAVLMIALGLSMFDRRDGRPIWEMQLPTRLTSHVKSRAGYVGATLMGLMVGIVAAPCIGPIVVALIELIGSTRNVPLGLLTFFTLGIGLATPYLVLGFGLIRALPKSGEWMVAVKHIFGLILFGMALYYLNGLIPAAAYRWAVLAFALASGGYLLLFDRAGERAKFALFKRAVGIAAIAAGIWLFIPRGQPAGAQQIGGAPQAIMFEAPRDFAAMQARLRTAQAQKRDVLIDFSASWCAACKELDDQTFHDPQVARATANFIAMRFRLENFESAYSAPFRRTFGIVGLPTVVHLVPEGGGRRQGV